MKATKKTKKSGTASSASSDQQLRLERIEAAVLQLVATIQAIAAKADPLGASGLAQPKVAEAATAEPQLMPRPLTPR